VVTGNNGQGSSDPAGQTPPGNTPPPADPGTGGQAPPATDPEADDYDKDRALSTIRAQRSEEKKLRAQLAELQGKVQQHDQEKLSETEKLQAKVAELEKKTAELERDRRDLTARQAALTEAAKLGIIDPELAYLSVVNQVEYDAEGKPANLAPLFKDLVKVKPWLLKQQPAGSANGGAGHERQPADVQPGMDRLRYAYEQSNSH
jgi:hypothetical protein